MFCKIVEQMFYKVAGLGHRTTAMWICARAFGSTILLFAPRLLLPIYNESIEEGGGGDKLSIRTHMDLRAACDTQLAMYEQWLCSEPFEQLTQPHRQFHLATSQQSRKPIANVQIQRWR